jgi:hypothetical protein
METGVPFRSKAEFALGGIAITPVTLEWTDSGPAATVFVYAIRMVRILQLYVRATSSAGGAGAGAAEAMPQRSRRRVVERSIMVM